MPQTVASHLYTDWLFNCGSSLGSSNNTARDMALTLAADILTAGL